MKKVLFFAFRDKRVSLQDNSASIRIFFYTLFLKSLIFIKIDITLSQTVMFARIIIYGSTISLYLTACKKLSPKERSEQGLQKICQTLL